MKYDELKVIVGVVVTLGLYSVLWKENKFYRLVEHVFLGLAAGWMLVAVWTETLYEQWWVKMYGIAADTDVKPQDGYWLWAMLLPIGLMGYFVFSKKNSWLARVPIGIIIGMWAGQQFDVWAKRYLPQLGQAAAPIFPTPNADGFFVPANPIPGAVYPTQALVNLIALITFLSVVSYFLFSVKVENKFFNGFTKLGRYLLMIGFGAIFGSTVMTRFSLLIDRMYYIWVEGFQKTLHLGG